MLPSGVCTKKWKESLATNTTRLLTVSTYSVLYCGIHLIVLSRYPTRYISHPFSTYDDMFVLYQSTLCSLHLCLTGTLCSPAQSRFSSSVKVSRQVVVQGSIDIILPLLFVFVAAATISTLCCVLSSKYIFSLLPSTIFLRWKD